MFPKNFFKFKWVTREETHLRREIIVPKIKTNKSII